jgi:hypothetical protein
MKLKKLNAKGFSHEILLVAFVVIFAVAGVAYIVASHADSCSNGGTAAAKVNSNGGVSAPSCSAVSVSGPVAKVKATCKITGVTSHPKYNQTLSPIVAITNHNSRIAFVPRINNDFFLGTTQQPYQKGGGETVDLGMLLPKKTITYKLNPFVVVARSSNNTLGTYKVSSVGPQFSCTAHFVLPKVIKM